MRAGDCETGLRDGSGALGPWKAAGARAAGAEAASQLVIARASRMP